jgi:hypothetical protein
MSESVKVYSEILSEPRLPIYRLISLAESGAVCNIVRLSADDDAQAREQAKMMVERCAVELWDGLRFIDHYAPVA